MANDDRTDRFRPVFEPEDIFDRFVKNANASTEVKVPRDDEPTGVVESSESKQLRGGPPSWDHAVTVKGPAPRNEAARPDPLAERASLDELLDADEEAYTTARGAPLSKHETMTDSGQRILLLTRKKPSTLPPPIELEPDDDWESVIAPRGQETQKIEAAKVVPDVGSLASRESTYVGEGVEDGQMPTRQLDQLLGDMAVLLRYGHPNQVRDRLELLRRTYPEDLLLLRRIAEFHVEHAQKDAALDTLFALAGGLFERRNVEGMRQALEQVLVLDPDNARAYRLLSLLEQRTDEPLGR